MKKKRRKRNEYNIEVHLKVELRRRVNSWTAKALLGKVYYKMAALDKT